MSVEVAIKNMLREVEMDAPKSWRELLERNIGPGRERQRIAGELGVAPITLTRWASGESNPRIAHLYNLLQAMPQQRVELQELIEKEFPGFSERLPKDVEKKKLVAIPLSFYERVLHTYATVPATLLFESLCNLILLEILDHLDGARGGMAVIVARCMPPSERGKIHSLRECVGRGTAPWRPHLEQQPILLGSESLAGHAVHTSHVITNPHLDDALGLAAGYRDRWEASAVAAPITRAGLIAGSLLVSSTQVAFFQEYHLRLIQNYAELLALAFEPGAFYETSSIDLWPLPFAAQQRPYIDNFAKRVTALMVDSKKRGEHLTLRQAEQLIWQRIEKELFSTLFSK
jgi:transcriptional regulator with XRE-family HTH domain